MFILYFTQAGAEFPVIHPQCGLTAASQPSPADEIRASTLNCYRVSRCPESGAGAVTPTTQRGVNFQYFAALHNAITGDINAKIF